MKQIYSIVYRGVEINFLKDKEYIGYNFKVKEQTFGYKVELKTRKQVDVFGIITTLTINAVESIDSKLNEQNTNN